jgi:hypothetical protein
MSISFEEALGLLSKWKTESTPVIGVVVFDGGGGTFWGFITELDPNGFVVAQQPTPESKSIEMLFALGQASEFDYQDLREAPEHIRASIRGKVSSLLSMKLGTSALCLYEMERPEE